MTSTFLLTARVAQGVPPRKADEGSFWQLQLDSTPLRNSGSNLISVIASDRLWGFWCGCDVCFLLLQIYMGFFLIINRKTDRALTCKQIPRTWHLKTLKTGPQEKSYRIWHPQSMVRTMTPQSWFLSLKQGALVALFLIFTSNGLSWGVERTLLKLL